MTGIEGMIGEMGLKGPAGQPGFPGVEGLTGTKGKHWFIFFGLIFTLHLGESIANSTEIKIKMLS